MPSLDLSRDSGETLLQIEQLSVRIHTYRGCLEVIDEATIRVVMGEKVGLVGETGCGKSLTMSAAIGAIAEQSRMEMTGDVRFAGDSVLGIASKRLRGIRAQSVSWVPQNPAGALNPVFRIRGQLTDAIKYAGPRIGRMTRSQRLHRALSLLNEVGLPEPMRVLRAYPTELSGGMRQRVLIAMALAKEPKLLIADEPTTALDVTTQHQVMALMADLVDGHGASLVLIAHNLGLVKFLTDKAYVMYAGQVVENAPTEQLFAHPKHPYTVALLGSVPRLTGGGFGEGIPGSLPDYRRPPTGCRFRTRCTEATEKCETRVQSHLVSPGHQVACTVYEQ